MFDKQPTLIQEGDIPRIPLKPSHLTSQHILRMREVLQTYNDNKTFALDEEVIEILIEMHNLTDLINQREDFAYPELQVRSFVSARMSVEYRLLGIYGQPVISNFSKSVCLAAQIYANLVLRTMEGGSTIPHRISERLKNAITATLGEISQDEKLPGLMLWIAFIGGIGAAEGPLKLWFIKLIHRICDSASLSTWQDVHSLLSLWPWSEEFLADKCKKLWQEVEKTLPGN